MNSQNNNKTAQNKINTFLYLFVGFLFSIIVIFVAIRYDFKGSSLDSAAETVSEKAAKSKVIVEKSEKVLAQKKALLSDTSGDFYLGKEFAPVTLIEYASLSCPHCAHFHTEVVEKLIPSYVDTGKVKYVFREFPTSKSGLDAAKIARCAGGDRYFSFVKVFFKSQETWAFSKDYLNTLKSIAKIGGIDEARFNECLTSKDIENQILGTQKQANDVLDVKSTPTFFINGNIHEGFKSYDDVSHEIDRLLKGE